MPRYSVSVLIETDHAGMVEFSKSLSLMLPMIAGSSKIVNAVIAEPVKTLYDQPRQQPTEHNAP